MSWPYTRRSQRILLWSISPRTDEEEGQSFSNGRAARRGYPFLPRPPSGGCTVHRVPPLRGDNLSLMYKGRLSVTGSCVAHGCPAPRGGGQNLPGRLRRWAARGMSPGRRRHESAMHRRSDQVGAAGLRPFTWGPHLPRLWPSWVAMRPTTTAVRDVIPLHGKDGFVTRRLLPGVHPARARLPVGDRISDDPSGIALVSRRGVRLRQSTRPSSRGTISHASRASAGRSARAAA